MTLSLNERLSEWVTRWPVRLSAIVAAAVITMLLTGAWLWFVATSSVDANSLERQLWFARNGLQTLFERIPKDQESVTIWDDAVLRTREGDQEWMADNVGAWMAEYFGHDQAFVLDASNQPIHAMIDGNTVSNPAAAWASEIRTIEPLVEDLRTKLKSAGDNPTVSIEELATTKYVTLAGTPSIVSVRAIVPSGDNATVSPGTEFLHIAVKRLDAGVAQGIATEYRLDGARFIPAQVMPPDPAVPVNSASGAVLAFLTWDAYRPGYQMFEAIGPFLAAVSASTLLMIGLLLRSIWRSTKELDYLAFHDPLTGLPNRAMFDHRLVRALERASITDEQVAVFLVDVDRFKNVNDSLGHPAGDDLLRQMGQRIGGVAKEQRALVARVGGDEFALLQYNPIAGGPERLAAAIGSEARRPFNIEGEHIFSGVSLGLVITRAAQNKPADLLRWADIALFEAKTRGRGRFEVFSPHLDAVVMQRQAIERDLRIALEGGEEITVAYQPIFDATGSRVLGAEALLRWKHPVHGDLSPALVISIAEERGMIDQIGAVVLGRVCSFLRDNDFPWVAVNVSAVQLHDPEFANTFLRTAERNGVDPYRLQIEITETALINNEEQVALTLASVRRAGVVVALDDFGTGYSSLSYLRRYGIDKIKIDRSFIKRLGGSREDDAIVRSIISLARAMGRRVTAEGVETAQQKEHVAALGCHELQGYLLSKPLTALALLAFADLATLPGGRVTEASRTPPMTHRAQGG